MVRIKLSKVRRAKACYPPPPPRVSYCLKAQRKKKYLAKLLDFPAQKILSCARFASIPPLDPAASRISTYHYRQIVFIWNLLIFCSFNMRLKGNNLWCNLFATHIFAPTFGTASKESINYLWKNQRWDRQTDRPIEIQKKTHMFVHNRVMSDSRKAYPHLYVVLVHIRIHYLCDYWVQYTLAPFTRY